MRAKIWFAPQVIETIHYYKNGRNELSAVERLLEEAPLTGREYVQGVPAIRAYNRQFQDAPFFLTWKYIFLPLADFVAHREWDEVLVFHVGAASVKWRLDLNEYQVSALKNEVVEIYNLVKATA